MRCMYMRAFSWGTSSTKVKRYLQVKKLLDAHAFLRHSQQDQQLLFTLITTVNQAGSFTRVFLNTILNMFRFQHLIKRLRLITLEYEVRCSCSVYRYTRFYSIHNRTIHFMCGEK